MENIENETINEETNDEEIPLDDSDFTPKYRMRLIRPISGKKSLARELARRTGYTLYSLENMIDALKAIFEDAVVQEYDIEVQDLFFLLHSTMPPYNGVNAYKTRMTGKIVREDFPESKRIILRLSGKLRKLAKKVYDGNRDKENSD